MQPRSFTRREAVTLLATGSATLLTGALGCATSLKPAAAAATVLTGLDLSTASELVRNRKISPVELTDACLDRIGRLDPRMHSFITVTSERAMKDAQTAEREIKNGQWRGPLHGIPIGLKDNIDTAGVRTTVASAVFDQRVPARDAEVVERLTAAGAISLGKQNLHEFALGTTSAVSHYGAVANPWDLQRVAGGSSGGSAAAVAASLCFGAVGTDTGGSIRVPAACCGIVGFKPTFGVVSTRGIFAVSDSFDHAGPLCRTVEDAALMFAAMTDHQVARESQRSNRPDVSRLRVGTFADPVTISGTAIDPEIARVVNEAIQVIRGLVANVRDAELAVPFQLGQLIDADLYATHATYLAKSANLYDSRTRKDIEKGRGVSEADRAKLRAALKQHREQIRSSFDNLDVVVLPTLPKLPVKISDAVDPFAVQDCTFAFSLGGLPSISVPCGFSSSGLPIGLLVSGPAFGEKQLFSLAAAYQQSTDWHRRRPPLS